MNSIINKNGGNVEIKVRRMNFSFADVKSTLYFNNNSLLSAFGAAISGTFPPGESEFIESVRNYRDRITDEELKANIKHFIGQEGHHSHQHKRGNEVLNTLGWDAQSVGKSLAKSIIRRNKLPFFKSDKFRLALTVGMEHLTAVMADFMLNNPEVYDSLDNNIQELLFWHAVEEIEHKAVAFDVYMALEGDQKYLRRVLKFARLSFQLEIAHHIVVLMWKAKKWPSIREVKEFYRFFIGKKGMATLMVPMYKDYFKENFHPWDHQNQHLIDQWKEKFYRAEHDMSAKDCT